MLMGVFRYLHRPCVVGLCRQVDLAWAPSQKEQVWPAVVGRMSK